MIQQSSKIFVKQMDNPWLRNQVENHLFFGNYKWKKLYLVGVALYITIALAIFAPNHVLFSFDIFKDQGSGFVISVILASVFYKYEISVFFWGVIKVLLLFMFFILFLCGVINSLSGEKYAYFLSVLGVVWLPSVEFIKIIVPYQRYVTLLRVAVTIPMICMLK